MYDRTNMYMCNTDIITKKIDCPSKINKTILQCNKIRLTLKVKGCSSMMIDLKAH